MNTLRFLKTKVGLGRQEIPNAISYYKTPKIPILKFLQSFGSTVSPLFWFKVTNNFMQSRDTLVGN